MQTMKEFEIGAMFWAGEEPRHTLAELKARGFHCGQIGVPGDLDLSCAAAWRDAAREAEFTIYTAFAAFNGESYADIPAVKDTVGYIPRATRKEREARTLAVSDFAATVGIPGIATHVGFVPENPEEEDYIGVREVVRAICDHAAKHGQTFALETGQERAEVLLGFLHDVNRPNLGINFDPANLILYGSEDPVEALGLLAPHLLSVHAKDGDWPAKDVPGALGQERPLGSGAVGMERFLGALKHAGYRGPLAIEREGTHPQQRFKDIVAGAELLRGIKASLSL